MNVSIVGTGYVGLTTGVCLAYLGHKVVCIDSDEQKIAKLRAGECPFFEPHLPELMAQARANLRFTPSYQDGLAEAEVIFIAVGTPAGANGSPDLAAIHSAARSIGRSVRRFVTVVNKSTVPIGSANWVESLIAEAVREHGECCPEFAVCSNPEFLQEGSAVRDSLYPDRIVIGSEDSRSTEALLKLYEPIVNQNFAHPSFLPVQGPRPQVPVVVTGLASAELIKYAANAFLALKISYINEVSCLAGRVGANIRDIAKGIGLDSRIGPAFLQAGIGWGGSCFGKDTAGLISTALDYRLEMPIVSAAREINRKQREAVSIALLNQLRILKGRTIALFGLAFKPNTDDVRDAPAFDIARDLTSLGARLRVHDPVAAARFKAAHPNLDLVYSASPEEAAAGADCIVLATEWPEYLALDWRSLASRMRHKIVFDGRHALNDEHLCTCGFTYLAPGRTEARTAYPAAAEANGAPLTLQASQAAAV